MAVAAAEAVTLALRLVAVLKNLARLCKQADLRAVFVSNFADRAFVASEAWATQCWVGTAADFMDLISGVVRRTARIWGAGAKRGGLG